MNRYLVVIAALFLAAPALAEDYYVGASLGGYAYEESSIEISESTIGIYAGWKLLPNVAIEGQWIRWSEGEDSIFEPVSEITNTYTISSVDTLALYAKPSITIADSLDVYGKIGFSRISGDFEITEVGPVGCGFASCNYVDNSSYEDSGTDIIWGVGGEYNLPNAVGLRAEILNFEVADESTVTYLLSAHYRFD